MTERDYSGPEYIDMNEVARLVEEMGYPAFVQQTGGGTATIYAGDRIPDPDFDEIYEAAAGPGWFTDATWSQGYGLKTDFYVGPDGETDDYWTAPEDCTEQDVAHQIVLVIERVRRERGHTS